MDWRHRPSIHGKHGSWAVNLKVNLLEIAFFQLGAAPEVATTYQNSTNS